MSELPTKADLVVAGCGIVGLSLAWQAARLGLKVAALDRGAVGGSTSAGTFAWVNATSKTANEAYHRLNANGLAEYESLAATIGAETCGLYGKGSLQWCAPGHKDLHDSLKLQFQTLRAWNYPVRWLGAAEMRRSLPTLAVPDDAEGILAEADRWVEVPRLLAWLTADIEKQGGAVIEEMKVTGCRLDGGGALRSVVTAAGEIATPNLAICAGTETGALIAAASAGELPAEALAMRAQPGFLVETGPAALARRLDLILWAPDEEGFHLRATAQGGLLLGAEDIDGWVGDGDSPAAIEKAQDALLARAKDWLPDLDPAKLAAGARWRIGRRALPADGHSVIGALAAMPGVFVAVTHSGVTLAPWIGKLLAAEIAGRGVADDLAPFRPARLGL